MCVFRGKIGAGTNLFYRGVIFGEPVGVKDGKSSMNIFNAACTFMSTLRGFGHEGIATSLHIQDGPLHSSLSLLVSARHSLHYSNVSC